MRIFPKVETWANGLWFFGLFGRALSSLGVFHDGQKFRILKGQLHENSLFEIPYRGGVPCCFGWAFRGSDNYQ